MFGAASVCSVPFEFVEFRAKFAVADLGLRNNAFSCRLTGDAMALNGIAVAITRTAYAMPELPGALAMFQEAALLDCRHHPIRPKNKSHMVMRTKLSAPCHKGNVPWLP